VPREGGCLLAALVLAVIIGAPGLYLVIKVDQADNLLDVARSGLERASSNALLAAAESLQAASQEECGSPAWNSSIRAAAESLDAAARALDGYASITKSAELERLASLAAQASARLEVAGANCTTLQPAKLVEAAESLREAASLGPGSEDSLRQAVQLLGG
jgi:hypothetical protein